MFRLTAPSEDDLRRFLSRQEYSSFSYSERGATAATLPKHYNLDHNRIRLGSGRNTWERAIEATHGWTMFDIPWLRVFPPNAPIQPGTTVAVCARHLGIYSLNACRIVYVVAENGPVSRYGFAYGTLTEHAERGEERFTVEWDRQEDTVWYDILAFSRPQKWLAKAGYPISRHLQKNFARLSKRAMLRAVA